jgi:hypothetical protein
VVVATAVKREWWVVAAAVVAALAVALIGLAIAGPARNVYSGSATITLDIPTISQYPALPTPDEVLRRVASEDFRATVAKEAGVSTETLDVAMSTYSIGARQDRIVVVYRSSASTEAASRAEVIGRRVAAEARTMGAPEILKHRQLIRSTRSAIRQLERLQARSGRTGDSVTGLWLMGSSLAEQLLILDSLLSTYKYRDTTVAVTRSASSGTAEALGAAALLGLAAGIAIGAVREGLIRRAQRVAGGAAGR